LTPAVTIAFTNRQLPAMRTQWQIKPNWHFTFYHLRHQDDDAVMGHVSVQGGSAKAILDQLDDTGIWSPDAPVDDADSTND